MAQLMQIRLQRYDAQPWGFRLQGGKDFAAPLVVQKINGGSLAEQAGLLPGDAVIKINDIDVYNLRHKEAQDLVVRSGNNFIVTVQRGGLTWRPAVTPTGQMPSPNPYSNQIPTVTKTSLAHKPQEVHHIGSGYNNSARPFNSVNGNDGQVKSIVNKQYNTPVGIYSDETIAETLSAQAEVLAGGVLGINFKKNEKQYQGDKSEVLKFLHEEESGDYQEPEPKSPANFYWTHSHAIGGQRTSRPVTPSSKPQDERIGTPLQQNTLAPGAVHRPSLPTQHPESRSDADQKPESGTSTVDPRLIILPVCPALQSAEYKSELDAAAAAASVAPSERTPSTTLPQCAICGVGIVGVFVRIKDKNLHVECFKCATCGTSLKNQGYYNFNNKLYCDIHARLAAMQNPPSGTDGYVPVPIKPNTKLSASTISAALNSVGYNGTPTNGTSTPSYAAPPSNGVASGAGQSSENATNGKADDSIYGSINPTDSRTGQGSEQFQYVTLHGNVIRSVIPPGKGVSVNYKVNQGFARPYGAPAAAPAAAPKSPTSYPPPSQAGGNWGQPRPVQQQQPANNPYATLPRSHAAPQGRPHSMYATQYRPPTGPKNNFYRGPAGFKPPQAQAPQHLGATNMSSSVMNVSDSQNSTSTSASTSAGAGPNNVGKGGAFGATSAPKRGRGIINKAVGPGVRVPLCSSCNMQIRGPFITALGRIWCPDHFMCVNANCRRPLQDIGFVEEKGDLYCEYCFEKYLAPTCSKCAGKIKGDCLNAM